MAAIFRRNKDHLLVQYTAERGGKKLYWRCPDEDAFERFCTLEETHKKAGTKVPDPVELFGEVPKPQSENATRRSQVENSRRHKTPSSAANLSVPSPAQWVGRPDLGAPGRYFLHTGAMSDLQQRRYESLLRNFGSHFADKPMHLVTVADAKVMMQNMIICAACRTRAETAGRKDLLAQPHVHFDSTKEPWDRPGACVDEEGESTHFSTHKRGTVVAALWLMRTLWRVAADAAVDGNEPQFEALRSKPFEKVGATVPQIPERATNDDLAEALSHAQLDLLRLAMPEWLRASARTGAYGLMRRSELLGLERGMITWPTLPEHHGQALIHITHTCVGTRGATVRRPWGKNKHSTRELIYLSAIATAELREHVETFRSTPDPDTCSACRDGLAEHTGPSKANPHHGCGFAADAPIWWDPERGERVNPIEYSATWFARAAQAAGLTRDVIGFRPTPKLLRATGATLLLDSGVPIEQVARMGRWKNVDVLRRHYHRMREESKASAAKSLDWAARGELGLPGAEDAPLADRVRFLQRRVEVLGEEVARYRTLLADLGVDLDALESVEVASVRTLEIRRAESPLADIDRIRELAGVCANRLEIVEALGLTSSAISRLVRVAKAHGIDLPKPWQRSSGKTPPKSVIESLTREEMEAIASLPTLTAVLAAVGVPMQKSYREQLQARAAELGVSLPPPRSYSKTDRSVLANDAMLRYLVARQPTRLAILRAAGIAKPSNTDYEFLERRVADLGLVLPEKATGRPRKAS